MMRIYLVSECDPESRVPIKAFATRRAANQHERQLTKHRTPSQRAMGGLQWFEVMSVPFVQEAPHARK